MNADSNLKEIQRKSIRGGAITLASQATTVVIQTASIVILARLLTPEDYGLMGMVMSFTVFAALFKDLGLSSAAIQKKNLSAEQQSNLFWLNTVFGLFLTLLVSAMAPGVAWFYGRSELLELTWCLSLNYLFASVSAQHNAMIIKNMQFGRQLVVNIGSVAVTFIVTVSLALQGYSYWSLAWGSVAGTLVRTLSILLLSPFSLGGWNRRVGTKALVGFGGNVTAFNFVNYFGRNLDKIVIGKIAGAEALGLYSRAYQLFLLPITNIRGPLETVAFPAMSQLDATRQSYRNYYTNFIRLLSWVTMPLMAWLFSISDKLVLLVLGEQWSAVSPIFSVLAIAGFIQPVSSVRGLILLSSGQSRRHLYAGTISASTVSIAFLLGAFWGVQGVAWAYAIAVWGMFLPLQAYCVKGTSIGVFDVILASIPAFSVSLMVVPSCWLLMETMSHSSNSLVVLSTGLCAAIPGAIGFLLAIYRMRNVGNRNSKSLSSQ